jgi:hypothetical protein
MSRRNIGAGLRRSAEGTAAAMQRLDPKAWLVTRSWPST